MTQWETQTLFALHQLWQIQDFKHRYLFIFYSPYRFAMFLQYLRNSKNNSFICTITDQAYDANGYTSENQAFIFI